MTCRFLNADGIAGFAGEIDSHNVFKYCCNDPINLQDPSGHFSITNWFKTTTNKVVNAFTSFFGAGHTVETTTPIFKYSTSRLLPYSVNYNNGGTKIISSKGNSNKPISVYAASVNSKFSESSAGLKINIGPVSINKSIGLSGVGTSISITRKNTTYSYNNSISIKDFEKNISLSKANQISDNTQTTTSVGFSENYLSEVMWAAAGIILFTVPEAAGAALGSGAVRGLLH